MKNETIQNNRLLRKIKKIACIFSVHLFLVVGMCTSVYCSKIYGSEPYEAPLDWMLFVIIDFPMSSFVLITAGHDVVSVPAAFGVDETDWFFRDVLWPGIIFQIIGTINWVILFYLCRYRIY